ncbi:MAG: Beta-lactamase domain protein [Marinimicrobia bacterium 46_47]|nr:MAG: Beta-lactamase domain protein [Marinimicrobia bacterium 46_47]KUK91601.1 MAG: beta-lactamase domain-containing protein [Marinimicrobia bacterium 46_43]HBY17545.1 MBL fold metallo-hydrolase [Candidatus Neomarinimicrobiota bacterium]
MSSVRFLGATGTVTGSKYVFENQGKRIMIDCGLFQGLKELRQRNWAPLPLDIHTLDAIVLTHAHIDHTGYLPRLVKQGYSGPVYANAATADLLKIMLMDSAHLQEEDARFLNKIGATKHTPALPLYNKEDAEKAIALLEPVSYGFEFEVIPGVKAKLKDAGHILGSSFVNLYWETDEGDKRKIVFSGDLGRANRPILKDPATIYNTDYLLVESTYGNRLHKENHPEKKLEEMINETIRKKGSVIIPSFAVGRTQELLYILRDLEEQKRIPQVPVFVDSPMAINATEITSRHIENQDLGARLLHIKGVEAFRTQNTHFTQTREESQKINDFTNPCIIISASGMLTGGRILHHLKYRLPDPKHTVLFIGYQAEGTRGRAMLEGKKKIKIHGEHIPVKARVEQISGFSAHADYEEILAWLAGLTHPPKSVFIVHGEPEASRSLAEKIKETFHWTVHIPQYDETYQLK